MIYKYSLTFIGDNFIPKINVLDGIKGDYIIEDSNKPDDNILPDRDTVYGFGSITFIHPRKFSTEDHLLNYEKWLVDFIMSNYELFRSEGVRDIILRLDIFYRRGQCNFEILNSKQLRKICRLNISLPVSIYMLNKMELTNWEKEITLDWECAE